MLHCAVIRLAYNTCHKWPHPRGFTLLECLVALLLAVILLLAAIPSWRHLNATSCAISSVNQLITALYLARTAAIERGVGVSLCGTTDGQTCSGDWSLGQLVFVDASHTGKVASPQMRLRAFAGVHQTATITWRGFPRRSTIQFLPTGFTREQNGTFYYCPLDNDDRYARAVILSKTGRARRARDDNGDGYYQDGQGQPLHCG